MSAFELATALGSGASTIDVPTGRHLVKAPVVIRRSVTLRGGPGVVLDGGGTHGLLRIDAPGMTVTLEHLTFENAEAHQGAAVHLLDGSLVITACTFIRCRASRFGGGAVSAAGERLEVRRCRFLECLGRQGGAVLLDEEVEALLCDSLFAMNAAVLGGALRLREGAQARVVGCTFADNRAVPADGEPAHGHSLYLSGSTTRAPSLSVVNTLVASHRESTSSECFVDPVVGGKVTFHASLLPTSMKGLGDATCRFESAPLASDYVPRAQSAADGLADSRSFAEVSSVDLLGAPRKSTVGAYVSR